MPIKIRLQRHGRKGVPFYHIVVTDSRSPRDGKFIKILGIYNPLTKTIKMFIKSTIFWLDKGAQPTNTARFLLSKIGLLYKKHLLIGIRKGAFDNTEAENRFDKWIKKNKNVNVNKNILVFMKK
jgi:small subunit ribosomal protein S16